MISFCRSKPCNCSTDPRVIAGWGTGRRNFGGEFLYRRLKCESCSHRWSVWVPHEDKDFMQLDLIPRTKCRVAPGVWHIPDWLSLEHQNDLITLLRHWTNGGWYTPQMPDSTPMKHPLACLGYRWKPYTYFEPLTPFPGELTLLGIQALIDAQMDEFLPYSLETAIVNYFPHGSSLGMHQDKSEDAAVIERGSPIITISLGDTAIFRLGNCEHKGLPWQNIELRSGDLLVMGGFNRLAYHGVMEIQANTAPAGLQMRQAGRISVTMREVHLGENS